MKELRRQRASKRKVGFVLANSRSISSAMALTRYCSRRATFWQQARAGNGPNPPIRKLQKIRLPLPGRYKIVERGGRGWEGGEVGGSAGPFSKSARRGAPGECGGAFAWKKHGRCFWPAR